MGNDQKSGIQIRTSQVTRGWWNIVRASGFSNKYIVKDGKGFRTSPSTHDVVVTLIQHGNNVLCPVGYYTATGTSTPIAYTPIWIIKHRPDLTSQLNQCISSNDLG